MCLVGTVMTHGLMVLFQTWYLRVKAFIKYTPVSCLNEATFVMVVPRSFKGKSSIIELTRPRGTSAGKNPSIPHNRGVSQNVRPRHDWIADMFKQQLLEPLIVFQIFSVCLYMLDEYWQYLLFTLAMIIMFAGVTVMSRLKNLQTLCGMGDRAREVYVHREKTWKKVNYDRLVPGDVISIKRETDGDHDNMVPCDCLLDGSAVLNKATLTGETV
ncbi:hypothetical protein PsorP6_006752 [Peronosclerospora sorghi]|uniref:Uncharacterized protein n=1 Tax=Peronosclerospora sorghi TaxID=230839 RepID=A0ACC0W3P5_9STRA|nr:hypothetical protein PsorP6_006752 [Peronosclerospora sorghi]